MRCDRLIFCGLYQREESFKTGVTLLHEKYKTGKMESIVLWIKKITVK